MAAIAVWALFPLHHSGGPRCSHRSPKFTPCCILARTEMVHKIYNQRNSSRKSYPGGWASLSREILSKVSLRLAVCNRPGTIAYELDPYKAIPSPCNLFPAPTSAIPPLFHSSSHSPQKRSSQKLHIVLWQSFSEENLPFKCLLCGERKGRSQDCSTQSDRAAFC